MKLAAIDFDKKFDDGESIIEYLDLTKAKKKSHIQKRVNINIPVWMIESLDKETERLGITRQSIIKTWLADRLQNLQV
jgi:hypothetical protein